MKKLITLSLFSLFAIGLMTSCAEKSPTNSMVKIFEDGITKIEKANSMEDIEKINGEMQEATEKLIADYPDFVPSEDDQKVLEPVAKSYFQAVMNKSAEFTKVE